MSSTSDLDSFLSQLLANEAAQAAAEGFETVEAYRLANDAREEARKAARELQERSSRRAHSLSRLGARITDRVRDAIVAGTLARTDALVAVQEWLASDRPILVLSGGVGTGKTAASAWALAERGSEAQFVRAVQIGAHYERWQSDRESQVEPLRMGAGLLIVDDLGQETIEDRRVIPALEEIVDSRQSARLRTLFTTNLAVDKIRERYSARMLSRLAQSAMMRVVTGTDMRRVK